MILSGMEINRRRTVMDSMIDPINGELFPDIVIDPFRPENLNPNSYNITLHPDLIEVVANDPTGFGILDMKSDNGKHAIRIPEDGIVLWPRHLYLGRTVEYTETRNLVPMIEGRSSIGRLGMLIHVTAGFGDIGFCGYWTLEIVVIKPLRIYPNIQVGQLFYHTVEGDMRLQYTRGKYGHNTGIQTSRLWQELGRKD